MTKPVTWDQLVKAAQDQHKLLGAQGRRAESLTVWLNALIESAGGRHHRRRTPPTRTRSSSASTPPAGKRAGEVMHDVATSGVVGAGLLHLQRGHQRHPVREQRTRASWSTGRSSGAGADARSRRARWTSRCPTDYGWALYPRVDADTPSAPPLRRDQPGRRRVQPATSDFAYQATECITSDENQAYYFETNGNPASSVAVYDDPAVQKAFPMADDHPASPCEPAAPRPLTPYYSEITGGLQREYHPPAGVDPTTTGKQADDLISAVLRGDQLL